MHKDELVQSFNILASKVHPLALGNVKRFMVQSRMMAKKLLELHMSKVSDEHKIVEIVENLTSKLYYHGHPINRQEAIELGLKVSKADEKLEDIMWRLFLEYENEMLLDTPFRPVDDFVRNNPSLPANATASLKLPSCKGVFIESLERTDVFSIDFEVFGQRLQNLSYQTNLSTTRQGWQVE